MKQYRLDSMQYAHCKVLITEHENSKSIILRSYDTDVIEITIDTVHGVNQYHVLCTGTYSATTARHINRFTREFFDTNLYHYFKNNIGEWYNVNSYASSIDHALEWYLNNGKKARY